MDKSQVENDQLSAPILRLPSEVLSEVLIHYVNQCQTNIEGVNDSKAPLVDPFCEPILLGNVCHTLRNVAWSTPQLWSSINLTLHLDQITDEVDRLRVWLARSRDCPLKIRIRCARETLAGRDVWAENPPYLALDALSLHCERWQDIHFVLPMACFSSLDRLKSEMMMLRKITFFRHGYTPLNEYSGTPISAFSQSPKLEDVSLFGISPYSITLPWNQLIGFRGYDLWEDEIMFVLNQAPQLLRSTFRAYLGDRTLARPATSLQHNLSSLSISEHSGYIKNLILPELRKIKLKANDWCWNPRNMISLLERSSCSLERLHLSVGFISEEGLLTCLAGIPTLREFKLSNLNDKVRSVFTDKIIRRLTPPGLGKPVLVPRLQSMDIFTCAVDFTPGLLVDMLWSRWRPGLPDGHEPDAQEHVACLKAFRLSSSAQIFSSIYSEIWKLPRARELEREGMPICIVPS